MAGCRAESPRARLATGHLWSTAIEAHAPVPSLRTLATLVLLLGLAACSPGAPSPSPDAGSCASGCDDANPCTTDTCVESACTHLSLSDHPCDDANACTTADVCRAGVCVGEAPIDCGAPGVCEQQGVCDPSTGQCSRPLAAPGTACDDGSPATTDDRCQATGACAGQAVICPADTACVTWLPDGTAACVSTLRTAAACDDANAATFDDRCGANGACAGTPVTCPASDTCSTWTPDGTASCAVTRHDGAACEDQDACTPTGACQAGTCAVGAPLACVNGGACAAGRCACPTGWTGPTCALDVDECALNACGGGSTCTNTQGSFSCQCATHYASATGANCVNTAPALELAIFYDEGVERLYGPQTPERIRSIFNRTKALYDTSLSTPSLTLSLNAVVRLAPLPGQVVKRPCDTVSPTNPTCGAGCWGQGSTCGSLLSTLGSEVDTNLLLSSFTTYTNTTRRAALTAVSGGFDVAVLITDADFAASVTGLAWTGSACSTSTAAAIVSVAQRPIDQVLATVLAHELGHNLNMQHDPTGSTYIMAPSISTNSAGMTPTSFSAQSLTSYRSWAASPGATCVADEARDDWAIHQCGDGVIDEAETCDPAIAADTCCSGTCQLNPGCACGNTEPCCSSGAPRASGTVCRAARSECDLADSCDGQTGACLDRYESPRTACSNGGSCLRGQCASRTLQCSTVNPTPPYDSWVGCETSTRCDVVQCTTGTNVCGVSWSIVAKDGTNCGAASQCVAGLCVASDALKDYSWVTGAWSACSPQGTSTRTVTCVDETGTPALASVCDPAGAPSPTRACTP